MWLLLLLGILVAWAHAQDCLDDGTCDQHERCRVWAEEGECLLNKRYMDRYCAASCADQPSILAVGECGDQHPRCGLWASTGECSENRVVMRKYCRRACGLCRAVDDDDDEEEEDDCSDLHENCGQWAKAGECEKNSRYMDLNCPKSCDRCEDIDRILDDEQERLLDQSEDFGVRQKAEGSSTADTLEVIQKAIVYMKDDKTRALPQTILDVCLNRHELCAFWATIGECDNNAAYMVTNCAPSCGTCQLIDMKSRCPPLPDAKPALGPGDLNKMFQRMVAEAPGNRTLTDEERAQLAAEKMPIYTVHVHSRPSDSPATEVSAVNDKSLPPWVITFEDLVTEEEAQVLIDTATRYGYKVSEDVGPAKFDGTHEVSNASVRDVDVPNAQVHTRSQAVRSERRTSENAWCSHFHGCRDEEVPTRIHDRLAKIMGIPPENSEDLQML